jgi:hypothetical protein
MSYSMSDGVKVAEEAAAKITAWLVSKPETIDVRNVEQDSQFQTQDIDLIWTTQQGTNSIEIKGDRWHQTGNFFFETHSNFEKGTPGCFMYTEANWLFYYFVTPRTLYMLPMPATREWFQKNIDCFQERSTKTSIKGGSYYTTKGRIVPIECVLQKVLGVVKEQL